MEREAIFKRVRSVVAEALACELEEVTLHASLIDDLGAESIDLLDIKFQAEKEFDLVISEEELYGGRLRLVERGFIVDGKVTEKGVALIENMLPHVDLFRFKKKEIYQRDLSRLVTVQTIVDYLENRLRDQ